MRLLVTLVALVACDQGSKPAPAPAPQPEATGVVRGRVTLTMHGPGADDGRTRGYAHISGLKCTVTATLGAHEPVTVTTNDDGAYELKVAPGGYEVSFADCGKSCEGRDPVRHVNVVSGQSTTVDWNCDGYAK